MIKGIGTFNIQSEFNPHWTIQCYRDDRGWLLTNDLDIFDQVNRSINEIILARIDRR
jgi:hypothetical protein